MENKITFFVETEKSKLISTATVSMDLDKLLNRYYSDDPEEDNKDILKNDEQLYEALHGALFEKLSFSNSKWDGTLLTSTVKSKLYPKFKMIFVSNPGVDWGFEDTSKPPETWNNTKWNEMAETLFYESDTQILVDGRNLLD